MNGPGPCDGLTAHGAAHKSLWLVSRRLRQSPSPLKKEQIQCPTASGSYMGVCYGCWQTWIGHLQTAARKRLQMCWGNNPVPAAEDPLVFIFSQRESAHRTATLQTHGAPTEHAASFPYSLQTSGANSKSIKSINIRDKNQGAHFTDINKELAAGSTQLWQHILLGYGVVLFPDVI